MLIKSIKIRNFRQYKKVDLDFSIDPGKNITIIKGENTHGKTTLVRAFLWCLYRDNKIFNDPFLLNADVAAEMNKGEERRVSVTIDMIHSDTPYRITTQETYKKDSSGKVIISNKAHTGIVRDSMPLHTDAVDLEISKILKKDLKDYFFYDGENNTIEKMGSKANIKEAVSQMMGIKRLESLRNYFKPNVATSVSGALLKQLTGDVDLIDLQSKLDTAIAEKEAYERKISKNNNEIDRLNAQKDSLQAIIDANKDIIEINDKIKSLSSIVESKQKEITPLFNTMISNMNGKGNRLFKILLGNCYKAKNISELSEKTSYGHQESLTNITADAIDQLIKRGRCLCGAPITNTNEAYEHLQEAKKHMEPYDFGKYLTDFIDAEASNYENSKYSISDINNTANELLDKIELIEINKAQIQEYRKQIEGRKDVGDEQKQIREIEIQIGGLIATNKFILAENLPKSLKQIEFYNQRIKEASYNSEKNRLIKLCILYANRIYKDQSEKINKTQEKTRQDLQTAVNSVFQKMYHGERTIEIDSDFNISTITDKGELDKSSGTEVVKNFSFVAGLLNLIKNNVILKEFQDDDTDETYPLVLDAPFSNVDPVHIRNICENLPLFCDQMIIVVMKHHYDLAQDVIGEKVGKIYRIDKNSETDSEIKEEI